MIDATVLGGRTATSVEYAGLRLFISCSDISDFDSKIAHKLISS